MHGSFALFLGLLVGGGLLAWILLLAIAGLIFAFEIYMFISAITNIHLSAERKLLWIIGMIVVHPFVAIAYYFTDYKLSR